MKHILLVTFLFSITSCIAQSDISKNFKKLEWLVGKWDRTQLTKPGRSGYELWNKVGDQEFRGHGGVLQDQDTLFVERFAVIIKDAFIYYVAEVPGNNQPTYFRITSITKTGFVCENPEHDFPKKITYQLEGVNLKAQISGNGKSSDFFYTRSK